jgi:hypothetical protein
MIEVPICPECRTPTYITSEHVWLGDGAIVQTKHPENRVAFFESENFDPLFKGIEELIGTSIDHIVVNVARRMALAYMTRVVSNQERDMLRSGRFPPELAFETTFTMVRILGMGAPSLVDLHFEHTPDDYIVVRYTNPYSAPITAGTLAGTVEAYIEQSVGVTYEYVSPEAINARVFSSEHPEELKHRPWAKAHQPGQGDIKLGRCPACGGPAMLSRCRWDIDQGIIRARSTGRRMAIVGPQILDGIFEVLKSELGEDIPRIVVEAQRRFVRNGFYPATAIRDPRLGEQLALRGLGDLRTLDVDQSGARMNMNNTVLPLITVGSMQGLFELAYGLESRADWEIADDGTLKAEITPWD